jgi:hypothetical protein
MYITDPRLTRSRMNTTKEGDMISHQRKEKMTSYQEKRRRERKTYIPSRRRKEKRKT